MLAKTRKLLSLVLALVMLVTLFPAGSVVYAEDDNTLASLSYTFKGVTTSISLISDNVYPTNQENRYDITLPYYVKNYEAAKMPIISATPSNPSASVSYTQATAFPGTAKVSVAPSSGEVRNYYIRFKYAPGVIDNISNKVGTATYKALYDLQPLTLPEMRELFYDLDTTWLDKWGDYNRIHVDRNVTNVSPTVKAGAIPSTGDFLPDSSWTAYSWFCSQTDPTTYSTTYFNGASWIATANADRTQSGAGDALTFNINRGATIWVVTNTSAESANFTATGSGWTNSYAADKQLRFADGQPFNKMYSRHFGAGQVNIPKYGASTSRAPVVIVMWDAPGTGDTSLSTLTAAIGGVEYPIGIVPGQTTYEVMASPGNIPTISATLNDALNGAEMDITQATSSAGTATIKVISGNSSCDYTINFIGASDDSSLKTLTYTHPMLGMQSISLTSGITTYNVELPYGISSVVPQIEAQANDDLATITSIVQAETILDNASVTVLAEDGSQSIYTIHFTIGNPPVVDHESGNVIDLKTRFKTKTELYDTPQDYAKLYFQKGSTTAPVTTYDETTGYLTVQDQIDAAMSSENPYYTGDKTKWAYGDRTVSAAGNGSEGNPYRYSSQYVITEGTSTVLIGENVTKILALNDEKSVTIPVSDFYSFSIDKAATIYIVGSASGNDDRFLANEWIKEPGVLVSRGVCSTIQDGATYYTVPSGNTEITNAYSKHYLAGANVTIPNQAINTGSGLLIFVVWDQCNPNTELSDLKVNGMPIDGFEPATHTYTVEIPYGTTQIPVITATPSFSGASVSISDPQQLPGAATIYVDAADGVTNDSYTINYTFELLSAPEVIADDINNAILGLDLATMEYAISSDGGNRYSDYTSDPSPFLGGSKLVKVRLKAHDEISAGADTTLVYTPNAGDVSGDGVIDISDVIMAAEIAVGNDGYTSEQVERANASSKEDATVDIADVVMIAERAVGGATLFPVEQPPVVILKLDDLNVSNMLSFQKVADAAQARNIKLSFGVIGESLEDNGSRQGYYDFIKNSAAAGIEIWHHGYLHETTEYNGSSYESQKENFKKTVDLLQEKCNYTVQTFGSPFNNSDATTIQMINNEFPQIKVLLLAGDSNKEATQLNLRTRCDMETSTGVVNYNKFVENYYQKIKSPYIVLQGHAGLWDDANFAQFTEILDFLQEKGCRFMTPYEYYSERDI